MRKDYKTITTISTLQQKEFLLRVSDRRDIRGYICDCMTKKHIKDLLKYQNVYNYVLKQSIDMLYKVENFEDMEYMLVMMNSLFHSQEYTEMKRKLLDKLLKQHITLDIYCVIRHLVYLPSNTFETFIQRLHQNGCSYLECAKFCLIEDQYQLAVTYLRQLDSCDDEVVLDLLASHSLFEYMSLKRMYEKKKRDYCLKMA